MNQYTKLNETGRVILWVFGAMHGLERLGLVESGPGTHRLTPGGVSEWDRLDMEWQPSDTQIKSAVSVIDEFKSNDQQGIICLIQKYRDNRRELEEFSENWHGPENKEADNGGAH